MTRLPFTGPVRFRYGGDKDQAKLFAGDARKLLGGVVAQSARDNRQHARRIFKSPDGTVIDVLHYQGQQECRIYVPPGGVTEPWVLKGIIFDTKFSEYPNSEAALFGPQVITPDKWGPRFPHIQGDLTQYFGTWDWQNSSGSRIVSWNRSDPDKVYTKIAPIELNDSVAEQLIAVGVGEENVYTLEIVSDGGDIQVQIVARKTAGDFSVIPDTEQEPQVMFVGATEDVWPTAKYRNAFTYQMQACFSQDATKLAITAHGMLAEFDIHADTAEVTNTLDDTDNKFVVDGDETQLHVRNSYGEPAEENVYTWRSCSSSANSGTKAFGNRDQTVSKEKGYSISSNVVYYGAPSYHDNELKYCSLEIEGKAEYTTAVLRSYASITTSILEGDYFNPDPYCALARAKVPDLYSSFIRERTQDYTHQGLAKLRIFDTEGQQLAIAEEEKTLWMHRLHVDQPAHCSNLTWRVGETQTRKTEVAPVDFNSRTQVYAHTLIETIDAGASEECETSMTTHSSRKVLWRENGERRSTHLVNAPTKGDFEAFSKDDVEITGEELIPHIYYWRRDDPVGVAEDELATWPPIPYDVPLEMTWGEFQDLFGTERGRYFNWDGTGDGGTHTSVLYPQDNIAVYLPYRDEGGEIHEFTDYTHPAVFTEISAFTHPQDLGFELLGVI